MLTALALVIIKIIMGLLEIYGLFLISFTGLSGEFRKISGVRCRGRLVFCTGEPLVCSDFGLRITGG